MDMSRKAHPFVHLALGLVRRRTRMVYQQRKLAEEFVRDLVSFA